MNKTFCDCCGREIVYPKPDIKCYTPDGTEIRVTMVAIGDLCRRCVINAMFRVEDTNTPEQSPDVDINARANRVTTAIEVLLDHNMLEEANKLERIASAKKN